MSPRTIRRWLAGLPLLLGPAAHACPPPIPAPSAAERQAAEREDRGLLWSIEKDGRRSYLYGTLHVGRPAWVQPGPRVAAALAASEVLALEIDPGDAGVQAELGRLGSGGAGVELAPALKARLARQVERACLDGAGFAAQPPALQALMLTLVEARWAGLDPAYSQEFALAQAARAAGRRVVSLETVALQKQLLLPDDAEAARGFVEHSLEQLESGRGRAAVERLARAWQAGDDATLADYERWCDCVHDEDDRAALRALNDDRNPALAERIAALHAEGRRVFAAVGALHLTGAQALPRLLAARGFKVERVRFGQ